MATPDRDGGKPSKDRLTAKATTDPVLRNALRYTISAKEYQVLHKYIISRSKVLKRNTPTVSQVEKLVDRPGRDDHNAAAVRASLRVFVATSASLKAWAVIKQSLFKAKPEYVVLIVAVRPGAYILCAEGQLYGDHQLSDYHSPFPPFSSFIAFSSASLRASALIFLHLMHTPSANVILAPPARSHPASPQPLGRP